MIDIVYGVHYEGTSYMLSMFLYFIPRTKNPSIFPPFLVKFTAHFLVENVRYLGHFFSKIDKLILILQPLFEPDPTVPSI